MFKHIVMVTTALALSASLATPGLAAGKGQPSENANALGYERASQNSDGGIREHGQFGQEQSTFVQQINNGETKWSSYGEFLQQWKAENND